MSSALSHRWNARVLSRAGDEAAGLRRRLAAAGLSALRSFARPVLLDLAQKSALERDLVQLDEAVRTLVRRWGKTGRPASVHLHPEARSLAAESLARGEAPLGFTRYDVVLEAGRAGFTVLEVQAGDPSAMGWHDALAAGFDDAPELAGRAHWRGRLVEALRSLVLARVPAKAPPVVGFVCARESIVRSDHELLRQGFAAAGLDARVVDPRELTRRNGGLFAADGARLDVCVRDTIDELVLEPWSEGGRHLLAAWRAGEVEVLNPFASVVGDDKALVAALSEGVEEFTPAQREVLERVVPWTRVLTPALADEVRARREEFVLKPCDGYGGFGVVVGPAASAGAWDAAVAAALGGPRPFVVQRHVPLPRDAMPDLGATPPGEVELNAVGSLWCLNGRLAGAFHRLSPDAVVNVHQGGGFVPAVFTDVG